MERRGVTEENYATPEGAALRQAARGHAKTPESPSRAKKNPERYREYLHRKQDLYEQVIAKKERLFSTRIKYRANRAINNVTAMPVTGGGTRAPKMSYLRRFLAMTEDDIVDVDWSNDEWHFIFYH